MTGELMPDPEIRVSDAERNRVVEVLHEAVGEGRLTLAEFEERIGGVHAARTQGELVRFTADLPVAAVPQALTLRSKASPLRRAGRWTVPRSLTVEVVAASVKLDLTEAVLTAPTVDVLLDAGASSVTVVLPHGASAVADDVELSASTARVRTTGSGGPHLVFRGHLQASTLTVRHQRRFLWWRW